MSCSVSGEIREPAASRRVLTSKHKSGGTGASTGFGHKLYKSCRACRPIVNMSLKPLFVTYTVRAPLRSSAALVATVLP